METNEKAAHVEGKCNARNRQGRPCRRPAGANTPHLGIGACSLHGGSTPNHIASAQRKVAIESVGLFGLPRNIDPRDALLEEVHRTAGAIEWLVAMVNSLDVEEIVWGVTEERDSSGVQGDSQTRSAAYSMWVQMLADERKHLVNVAKAAVSAGCEQAKVEIAQAQGLLIAGMIQRILDQLQLTREQQVLVGQVVPNVLRGIEG